MELDTLHVTCSEHGGESDAGVGAGGGGLRALGDVVAVREVDVAVGRLERVPAHVGDARVEGEAADFALVKAEAADVGGLFGAFEEGLHAEANAKEGNAGVDAVEEGCADVEGVESAHHLAEVADAGEEDFGGGAEGVRSGGEDVVAVELGEGVLHAAEVAGAIVKDGNHASTTGIDLGRIDGANRGQTAASTRREAARCSIGSPPPRD